MDETSQLGIAGTLAQSTAQVHITRGEQSVADLAVRRQTNPVAGPQNGPTCNRASPGSSGP
jgi:hypothetical protein